MLVQELGKTTIQVGDRAITAHKMSAELRADQFLKTPDGNTPPFLTFHFILPDEFVGWGSIAPQIYGVFFLVGSPGELKVASPYYPFVVAVPGGEAQEGTTIERIINQLRAVLQSETSSVQLKSQAIFALSRTKSPAAVPVLSGATQLRDVTLRLTAAAALLKRDDLSTIELATDALLQPDRALPPDLLHNLSYAISEGIRDERAIPSLTRLLHTPSVEIRRAAASALMHTGSNSAIDPLLSALDDLDPMVRYYSVVGLAEITGQTDWRPNIDDFTSDPNRYLKHWHEWSQNR
jgi:HEAT repeat protein